MMIVKLPVSIFCLL